MNLQEYITNAVSLIDGKLDELLPGKETQPGTIHESMRYSIFAGGKKTRGALCLAAAEACGGAIQNALIPACAIEMVHTYSLIHDDLPCMDNDAMRRGKPTNHVVYGEAIALLAGDGLLTESFAVLAQAQATENHSTANFIKELAEAAGSRKMIGGQVLDLQGEKQQLNENELRAIHEGKTAALITCALRMGAMSANASREQMQALDSFGYNLGLAFQVIDDILDITSSSEKMGKTVGKDTAVQKSTYPALMGLDGARQEAKRLTAAALDSLTVFPETDRSRLVQFADYLLNRDY